MELNFNILLFGVTDVPNVTFAAHVKIRAAYDQVVNTERTSLEAEPLAEVCQIDELFVDIKEGKSSSAELVTCSIHCFPSISFLSNNNSCTYRWMVRDLFCNELVLAWYTVLEGFS